MSCCWPAARSLWRRRSLSVADSVVQTRMERVVVKTDRVQRIVSGRQGPPGPAGPTGVSEQVFTADGAVSALRVVVLDAGGLNYAQPDAADVFRLVGISKTSGASGSDITVVTGGSMYEATWNWDTTKPIYLAADGVLTQTPPPSGWHVEVGHPYSATRIIVDIKDPIQL